MKKIMIAFIIISILLSFTGCRYDETTLITENTREENLVANSEELAVQMAGGEFGGVVKIFSLVMKKQTNKTALKKAWDTTVSEMGDYIELYKSTEKLENELQKVDVVLRYENNGLKISFIYNELNTLEGLWFSYSPIEAERISNNLFEEIDITIGEGAYPVEGILTLPKEIQNPPVVIMVQGSGTHDMDETIGASANKPFRDIAWGLAKQGIASIRYNERLFQYPELSTNVTTIEEDVLEDASEAIGYAAASTKVDKDRIFILGHSLGGMMAPKIAYDHTEVSGIICLAGSPRRLEDIIVDQQKFLIEYVKGVSITQKNAAIALSEKEADKIRKLNLSDTGILLGYPSTYWYSLNQINIAELVKGLDIKIFIAQGAEDWQVYADKDYVAWQELLGNRVNVTFRLYDDLNHLFMKSKGRMDTTEYNIKDTVNQQVIEDLALWIKR